METFTDPRDGNTYRMVCVGRQCWMAENLKYLPSVCPATTSPDGSPCCFVYDYQGWDVSEAKAAAHYRNYGVLYNWPAAVATCPPGWHLPSDAEWSELTDSMVLGHGGLSWKTVAYALKACASPDGGDGRPPWEPAELPARSWRRTIGRILNRTPTGHNADLFGFSALPGGRCTYGGFYYVGCLGYWWSGTEVSPLRAWCRQMTSDGTVNRWDMNKPYGYSVRCVRD